MNQPTGYWFRLQLALGRTWTPDPPEGCFCRDAGEAGWFGDECVACADTTITFEMLDEIAMEHGINYSLSKYDHPLRETDRVYRCTVNRVASSVQLPPYDGVLAIAVMTEAIIHALQAKTA